jgi:hypothetical protein
MIAQPTAPITSAGTVVRCKKGNTVKVQIKVKNFKNIQAITLDLHYKTSVLTFNRLTPALKMTEPDALFYLAIPIDNEWTQFKLAWSSLTPFSLQNTNDLLCLYFTYNGGETDLIWDADGGNCEYAAVINGEVVALYQEPTENYYINGKVTNK